MIFVGHTFIIQELLSVYKIYLKHGCVSGSVSDKKPILSWARLIFSMPSGTGAELAFKTWSFVWIPPSLSPAPIPYYVPGKAKRVQILIQHPLCTDAEYIAGTVDILQIRLSAASTKCQGVPRVPQECQEGAVREEVVPHISTNRGEASQCDPGQSFC